MALGLPAVRRIARVFCGCQHHLLLMLMTQARRIVQRDAAQGNRVIGGGDFNDYLAAGDQGAVTDRLMADVASFIDREQWPMRTGLHMNGKAPHGFALL